jgi:glyoxylase-like metal-dependent hydrolase (beta-lactamase superfamily II)
VIHRLRRLLVANVYVLDGGPGDRWLVDTSHWVERAALVMAIRELGLWPSDIEGVLLTHRHSDHAGNARWLQKHFGMKVVAHEADAAILDGSVSLPWMDPSVGSITAGVLARVENRWPARVRVDRAVKSGETVGGLEVHHVPGHTEGSVFYWHEKTRSLLSGDTMLTAIPPLVRRAGLALPYPTFTRDMDQAHDSIRAFHRHDLPYENLLPGHGRPLMGNARRTFEDFLVERKILQRSRARER